MVPARRCNPRHISMPCKISKADVQIEFKTSALHVKVQDETLLKGVLEQHVDVDGCSWCLVNNGLELQVMLTKKDAQHQWSNLLSEMRPTNAPSLGGDVFTLRVRGQRDRLPKPTLENECKVQ